MKKHMITDNKGFTLTELLITISIIAILGGVAVTGYIGATLKANRSEAYANLEGLKVLEMELVAENGAYAPSTGVCAPDSPGNVALITAQLPGFQPGPGGGLKYSYCIQLNVDINNNAQVPCFRAQAFGNSAYNVAGDVFMIDCNNNKNY